MLNNQLQTKKFINFFRSTILKSLATVTVLAPVLMPTSAKAVTINFDQFNDREVISGDTFLDLGVVFDQELQIIATHPNRPVQSQPANALRNDPFGGDLSGYFTEAVDFISVYAGDHRPYNEDGSENKEILVLTGFDEFDNIVDSDTFTSLTADTLSISGPGIVRFEIVDENESGFGIDDFTFESVPEPTSVLGLLAFGAMGAVSMLKRK
ncbi:PEP-CTERM sorting domain-containing protein [Okeania sp. SIO3I5]|uniref:PEP-CTERM sorting domain-containing protein n=1 Tax=Okeania sp. SIO3I5 TaxID=2607805 RepID=UPI0025DEC307|nr:PEP-CTERM sorting domain-containing protein [Okeania sp. SIO3I5]